MFRLREGMGVATNNAAEYRGLILGLKYAISKGFKHIRAQGDSKLVCMQVLIYFFITFDLSYLHFCSSRIKLIASKPPPTKIEIRTTFEN